MTAVLADMPDHVLADTLASIDAVIQEDAYEATKIAHNAPLMAEIVQIATYSAVRKGPVLAEIERRESDD